MIYVFVYINVIARDTQFWFEPSVSDWAIPHPAHCPELPPYLHPGDSATHSLELRPASPIHCYQITEFIVANRM